MTQPSYRGRFAPSPTGDLHLGSLVAAIASYCQAKANNGEWLIRIEDIDETRSVAGAAQQIIATLGRFGLHSDAPVIHQTADDRQQAYTQALQALTQRQLTYPCTCTRKDLQHSAIYPGTCRHRQTPCSEAHSIRLKTDNQHFEFTDLFQSLQRQNIADQSGDFNIKRKDGLFCYQLAVVVDDADQGITEVVRGIDIMESTSRQMYLIQQLGLAQPQYAHFPVITDIHNNKLSKQNHAQAVTDEDPYSTTLLALKLLQQPLPVLKTQSQAKLLKHAVKNWQVKPLMALTEINHSG